MWLLRDPRRTAEDTVLAALRTCPPAQPVSLLLTATTSRSRPSILGALRAHAGAQHCRLAVAETRGVVVRWVDGIVTGTVEDVLAFLDTSAPLLDRCHGRLELPA